MTRTVRTYVVAAATAAIVTAANASQGAYFSQSWGWVALAFLVPTSVLLILDRVTVPGRLRTAFVCSIGALAAWIALCVSVVRQRTVIRARGGAHGRVCRTRARRCACPSTRRRAWCSRGPTRRHHTRHGIRGGHTPVPGSPRHVRRPAQLLPTRRASRILERAWTSRDDGDHRRSRIRCARTSYCGRTRSGCSYADIRTHALLHVLAWCVGRARDRSRGDDRGRSTACTPSLGRGRGRGPAGVMRRICLDTERADDGGLASRDSGAAGAPRGDGGRCRLCRIDGRSAWLESSLPPGRAGAPELVAGWRSRSPW